MNSSMIIIGLFLALTLSFGLGFFFGTVHTQNKVLKSIEEIEKKADDFRQDLETERDRAKRNLESNFYEPKK